MNPEQSFPHHRNLRLPEFDYSQPGAYFVTIVTQDRKPLFGKIVSGEMDLNEVGMMVKETFEEIPQHYQRINVDVFMIMPNHIHALFVIDYVAAGPRACPSDKSNIGQPRGVDPTEKCLSLPDNVHRFKSLTTHRYIIALTKDGWSKFEKRLWQRNYYEHVIRNERDYQAIYDYILANPLNWEKDEEYSACTSTEVQNLP